MITLVGLQKNQHCTLLALYIRITLTARSNL